MQADGTSVTSVPAWVHAEVTSTATDSFGVVAVVAVFVACWVVWKVRAT